MYNLNDVIDLKILKFPHCISECDIKLIYYYLNFSDYYDLLPIEQLVVIEDIKKVLRKTK